MKKLSTIMETESPNENEAVDKKKDEGGVKALDGCNVEDRRKGEADISNLLGLRDHYLGYSVFYYVVVNCFLFDRVLN